MRRLLPLILATALIAACGGDMERSDEPASPPPADETRLTIEVGGAGVDPQTIEVDCVTDPCDEAELKKLAAVTKPPDKAVACTQLYGGPAVLRLTLVAVDDLGQRSVQREKTPLRLR